MIKGLKRISYGVSALLLVVASVATTITFAPQASALAGAGTELSPWLLTSCADIQDMNDDATYNDDYFVVTNDIDCNGVNFTRIMFGNDTAFEGTFDGGGFTIRNVAVNNSVTDANGFFGSLNGATIQDLNFENIIVSGESQIGALAGFADSGYITNVTVTNGTVTGIGGAGGDIGGLIGTTYGTELFNIIVDVDVTAPNATNVGGLVGCAMASSLFGQVAALGSVEGDENVGGLVGSAIDGTSFDKAFATGNVTAHAGPGGGLVGSTSGSSFIGTYARGNVTGSGYLGGHTGYADTDTIIGWAYATGMVTVEGESIGGGLVGYADGLATIQPDTFWDVQTSGLEISGGTGEVGKTTAEMKDINTYIPFDWNFEDYWFQGDSVNDGYLCQIWYQVCYDAFMGNTGGSVVDPVNPADEFGVPNTGLEQKSVVFTVVVILAGLSLLAILAVSVRRKLAAARSDR